MEYFGGSYNSNCIFLIKNSLLKMVVLSNQFLLADSTVNICA